MSERDIVLEGIKETYKFVFILAVSGFTFGLCSFVGLVILAAWTLSL